MSAPSSSQPAEFESTGSPFQFLSDLARDLSAGRIDLPSFPDAAARVQHALSDDSITSERIARVVSSDAGLAARILTMANSTLLHRGGSRVPDLKVAITRIGHDSIRAAALAYNVGKVYIIARTSKGAVSVHIDDDVLRDWHPRIGQAADRELEAAGRDCDGGRRPARDRAPSRRTGGPADLQDLLIVAVSLADSALIRIMLESQTEMETLQAALG